MGRPLGSKNKKNSKNSAEKPKAIKNKTKKLANTTAESVSNTTTVAPSTSGYSLRNRIHKIPNIMFASQQKNLNEKKSIDSAPIDEAILNAIIIDGRPFNDLIC